jgi:RimJ/RimL family protein N-acetyltransferase
MPPFPDLIDSLASPVVELRLAGERDIPEILIAHQDDATLYRRLGLTRPPSGAELGRRAEEAAAERAAGTAVWLTILTPGSDICRGQIDVHDVDADHARAELAIWIAPQDRGRGLAGAALALVGRWLIGACGLERVQLLTDPDNQAMLNAGTEAGFQREGILRGYLLERGGRVDVEVLSLVRSDLA